MIRKSPLFLSFFFSMQMAISQKVPGNVADSNPKTPANTKPDIPSLVKEVDDAKVAIDAFVAKQKNSIFKFGASIAMRTAFDSKHERQARAIVSITPHDNFVSIDYNDLMAVIISTTVAAYPFQLEKDIDGKILPGKSKCAKFFRNMGFLANVNIVEFANSNTTSVFNKQVDGGLGLSWLLGSKEKFAFAVTYERISVRQPTQFIFDHVGRTILSDSGTPLTTLDLKDSRFFRDAGMNGVSAKFVYHFN